MKLNGENIKAQDVKPGLYWLKRCNQAAEPIRIYGPKKGSCFMVIGSEVEFDLPAEARECPSLQFFSLEFKSVNKGVD